MNQEKHDQIRGAVRENYGKIALATGSGCGCAPSTCCGAPNGVTVADISRRLGYSDEEVSEVPEGPTRGWGAVVRRPSVLT